MTETDETVKADGVVDSQELADKLNIQARKHRDFCNERIRDAEKQLSHWREQFNIITAFLAENQINEPANANGEPWFDPNAKLADQYDAVRAGATREDPEMAQHIQNLRDEVRGHVDKGWNYGPTDLR